MQARPKHSSTLGDHLRIHSAVFLFGLAGLFGKFLPLSPVVIVTGRTFWAATTLGLLLLIRKQPIARQNRRLIPRLLLLGFLLAVHWLTFFQAIQLATVAIGLLTYASYPIFVMIIASCWYQSKPEPPILLSLIVVIFGLVLITPSFRVSNTLTQGTLWGIASGLTFAILTLFNRHYVQQVSALTITGLENLGAFCLLLPIGWQDIPDITSSQFAQLIFLGVICTALAHWLFTQGLRSVLAQRASIVAALEPVYGILLAYILLGEQLDWRTAIGGLLILLASVTSTIQQIQLSAKR